MRDLENEKNKIKILFSQSLNLSFKIKKLHTIDVHYHIDIFQSFISEDVGDFFLDE